MKFTLEKRIVLTVALLVLSIGILIAGFIAPAIRYIKISDRDTYNLRLYLERRHEQSTNVRTALQRYEKIKDQTIDLDDYVFYAGHELELITTLETVAAQHKVKYKINNTNLDKLTNQRITMSLSANGSYTHVLSYLAELENLKYFLTIHNLKLEQGYDNETQTSTTALNLDLSLYVAP